MKLLASALRIFSFVFHLTLGMFLLTLAALAAYRGTRPVALDLMPFEGDDLLRGTALVGAAGIACSLLALTRSFKFVFVIWTAGFLYLMVKAFFTGPFALQGGPHMKGALWFAFGAAGAFFGAVWPQGSRRRGGLL